MTIHHVAKPRGGAKAERIDADRRLIRRVTRMLLQAEAETIDKPLHDRERTALQAAERQMVTYGRDK